MYLSTLFSNDLTVLKAGNAVFRINETTSDNINQCGDTCCCAYDVSDTSKKNIYSKKDKTH